jgi:uncharacterized protein YggT (Ycf19 family)
MDVICILLTVYWVILIARVLASFFPVPPSGPIRSVMSLVYALTEPVLDLSPIIVFVALGILRSVVCT